MGDRKTLCLTLSDEALDRLKTLSEETGQHPSELASQLLEQALAAIPSKPSQPETTHPLPDELRKALLQLTRRLQDLLIPYTGKLDDLNRSVAELVERMEKLEDRVRELAEKPAPPAPSTPPRVVERRGEARGYARKGGGTRPTAIERLRQQGVVFQTDLTWLNNPPAFFEKLRREGAVVIRLQEGYVAVDPEYWQRLERTLTQLSEPDLEEAARKLPDPMDRLFKALVDNELAYYDNMTKRWYIVLPEEE